MALCSSTESGCDHALHMRKAIDLSLMSVGKGTGPFGAVVVKDGVIVGEGHNTVTSHNDPTAHAEVNAIRNACKNLGTFNLQGCVLYTSCEPCPMCLSASYWARVDKMYYGNTRDDAAAIQFDDEFLYREVNLPIAERQLPMEQICHKEALEAFEAWTNKDDKIRY